MAIDAAGVVYVADSGNNRIRRVATSGAVTTVAGNAGATNSQWTYACSSSRCNYLGHLYCFEQTDYYYG